MTSFLFPRLRTGHARLWAQKFEDRTPEAVAADLPSSAFEGVTYAATGGERVPEEVLTELRGTLLETAKNVGYPDTRSLEAQRRFDLSLAGMLVELPIITGEALRDEVWQYLTCILVPDLVVWRYGKTRDTRVVGPTSHDRFLGGDRNMVERIWWRAYILHDPNAEAELWLLDTARGGLTEDNMVALFERGNIASYHMLCRTIANEYIRNRPYVSGLTGSAEQLLIREVMKKVVRLAAHMNLEAIPEDDRLDLIGGLFGETVAEMGGEAPSHGRVYDAMTAMVLTSSDLPTGNLHRTRMGGRQTRLPELLGKAPREIVCRWKWYWPDGSIRARSESRVFWHSEKEADTDIGEWVLTYRPEECPMRQARPGDILILATRLEDEELEAFLFPQNARAGLQVLGALKRGDPSVKVHDEVEEFVRETLHRRL